MPEKRRKARKVSKYHQRRATAHHFIHSAGTGGRKMAEAPAERAKAKQRHTKKQ